MGIWVRRAAKSYCGQLALVQRRGDRDDGMAVAWGRQGEGENKAGIRGGLLNTYVFKISISGPISWLISMKTGQFIDWPFQYGDQSYRPWKLM